MILCPGAGICGQHRYEIIAAPVTAIVQLDSNIQYGVVFFRYRSKSTKTSIDINGSLRGLTSERAPAGFQLGRSRRRVLACFEILGCVVDLQISVEN